LVIFLTILQVISGIAITAIVLMQSGKSAGLSGVIAGAADTFLSKNKAKSVDAQLARVTKWCALLFVVLTVVLNIMAK
jgi:preprotein translocase subunit SecG